MTVTEEVTVRLGAREKGAAITESGPASTEHTVVRSQPCKCDCSITANLCLHKKAERHLNRAKQPRGPKLLSKAAFPIDRLEY